MLSIMVSLSLRYEVNFFFEFNQSTIELYAYTHSLMKLTQYSPYYPIPVVRYLEKLSIS